MSKSVKRNHISQFNVIGDYDLFQSIVNDMHENGGNLSPSQHWGMGLLNDENGHQSKKVIDHDRITNSYMQNSETMVKMLDPWIGCNGLLIASRDVVSSYKKFLEQIDDLDLYKSYIDDKCEFLSKQRQLLTTDLGTMVDLNLINKFSKGEFSTILEVGGGYGRLAEGFFENFSRKNIKYLLLDSVPASLLYCYKYLSRCYPELRVGFYYLGDEFSFNSYDIYIMPSWHYVNVNQKYDVCINVQSMQEMSQVHVDHYLNLFNQVITDNGLIYLSNEKDYIFRGNWPYPSEWKKIFCSRTPRSWTRNSPTEIYKKNPEYSDYEMAIDLLYNLQLINYDECESQKNNQV